MDEKLVEQARHVDMILFFEKHCGFTFTPRGSAFRCEQHPSLAVKEDRVSWYWHSKGVGGYGALDYLMKIEGLPFRRAMEAVTDMPATKPMHALQSSGKPFLLPEKAGLLQARLFQYLHHRRGIDTEVIGALLKEEKIYQDKRGNVVFVGFDAQNEPRFASLRGTYGDTPFRMDCAGSDKRYGFHMGDSLSGRLYVFESPIDAMSHASLENALAADKTAWQKDGRLSLAGTSDTALPKYLETHPHTQEIVLCLDNDRPGRDAAVAIARKYADMGYRTRIELPQNKDYNEDLVRTMTWQKRQDAKSRW